MEYYGILCSPCGKLDDMVERTLARCVQGGVTSGGGAGSCGRAVSHLAERMHVDSRIMGCEDVQLFKIGF